MGGKRLTGLRNYSMTETPKRLSPAALGSPHLGTTRSNTDLGLLGSPRPIVGHLGHSHLASGTSLGPLFAIWDRNITSQECEAFVVELLQEVRGPICLVWDRWSVHRSAARRLKRRFPERLDVEWPPAYAPELNPVEQVWAKVKYGDLANLVVGDVEELDERVRQSLSDTGCQPDLARYLFHHTGLEL